MINERKMTKASLHCAPQKPLLIALLLIVNCSLLILSCPNSINTPESEPLPAGYGSFTLHLASEPARTIMPYTPVLTDFKFLNLYFTPTSGGEAKNVEIKNYNGSSSLSVVTLFAGTYNLTVSAYKDEGKSQLMAKGTLDGIVITAGNSEGGEVKLKAIFGEGTGTFKWNITLTTGAINVTSATMTVLNSNNIKQGNVEDINTTPDGSRKLASGLYTVVFNLTGTDADDIEKTLVWNELMYVYSSLDSIFNFIFKEEHFTRTSYNVTFIDNYTNFSLKQSVLHGDKVTEPSPTRSFTPYAGLFLNPLPENYELAGWDDSNNSPFDFNKDIINDITLNARWTAPDIDLSSQSGTTIINKVIAYINANANSSGYTLYLDEDVIVNNPTLTSSFNLTIRGLDDINVTLKPQAYNLFTIGSGITLTIGKNITIKGATNGGNGQSLVTVNTGGTFNMEDGEITGNKIDSGTNSNAAVYVNGGTFNMSGGIISNNSNSSTSTQGKGSAVYVNNGIFNMSGEAEITENNTSINTNNASYNSAAVYITGNSSFSMTEDSKVSSNTSPLGDVFIDSSASLTLSGNAAIGTLTLNATSAGNSCASINSGWTGSVSNLNLYVGNQDIDNGILLWLEKDILKGTFNAITVKNFNSVLFTSSTSSQPITDPAHAWGHPNGYYICSDETPDKGKLMLIPTGEVEMNFTTYETLAEAIEEAEGTLTAPTEITILWNITTDSGYTIPSGKHIKLIVEAGKNRTITAGKGDFPLFTIEQNASLTLQVGTGSGTSVGTFTLDGNDYDAGDNRRGVLVNGAFTLDAGVIITGFKNSNTATSSGGAGVLVSEGTFTMNGGVIKNNTSNTYGGGVFVESMGSFIMKGGTIYGNDIQPYSNTATQDGNAVYVSGGQAIYDGEYSIYGNIKNIENNTLPPH